MKVKLIQQGEAEFTYGGDDAAEIRRAIADAEPGQVPGLYDVTDLDRSDTDPDEHLTVTDDDGTVLWAGWIGGVKHPDPAQLAAAMAETRQLRERLAAQHEAMTQLRAGHSEALAGADAQVRAALKTVSRWQGENERLIAERDDLSARLADAVSPTAADYDNAAEILRLRDHLAGERARAAQLTVDRDIARHDASQLRADLLTLAEQWEASAARDQARVVRRPNMIAETRAEVRAQCAADLRKLAGQVPGTGGLQREIAAVADVHVDWHMTPAEWDELRGILLRNTGYEYIGQLEAQGALAPAVATAGTEHLAAQLRDKQED